MLVYFCFVSWFLLVSAFVRAISFCKKRYTGLKLSWWPHLHYSSYCRVAKAPSFTISRVATFNPFKMKQRRSQVKWYGVISPTWAVKQYALRSLIHLILNLFILALRHLIAIRRNVQIICSDNGSNFIGSENQLTRASSILNFWPLTTHNIDDSTSSLPLFPLNRDTQQALLTLWRDQYWKLCYFLKTKKKVNENMLEFPPRKPRINCNMISRYHYLKGELFINALWWSTFMWRSMMMNNYLRTIDFTLLCFRMRKFLVKF